MMDRVKKDKPIFILQTYDDRIASKELSQKLSERLTNLTLQDSIQERLNSRSTAAPPPPPPPPQETNNNTIKSKKGKAPPVPVKTSTLSYHQPPPCPTPDYDTLSITSTASLPKPMYKPSQTVNDAVEMESLESFKLNNPRGAKPKPPDTYFKAPLAAQISNGSTSSGSSLGKKARPVSVTIGEYPSGTLRKTPGRLDFLESPKSNNISSQFASELAQTLNRSNLRKRTESMENLLSIPQIKPQSNGSVRISLSSLKSLAKSTSDLTSLESFSKAFANRVTINVNGEKKTDAPNGILKNGTHKTLMQQKSITFGETPTVINDRQPQVT